jgi:hypothetical protein
MTVCQHEGQVTEGYYGYHCIECDEFLYPFGNAPWDIPTDEEQAQIDATEYAAMHWTCDICGGEWGDGWSTCTCDPDEWEINK